MKAEFCGRGRVCEYDGNQLPEAYERALMDPWTDFAIARGAINVARLCVEAPELTGPSNITSDQSTGALRQQIDAKQLDQIAATAFPRVYDMGVFSPKHFNEVTDRRVGDTRSTTGFHPDRPSTLVVISFDITPQCAAVSTATAYAYGLRYAPTIPAAPFCNRRSLLLLYRDMLRAARNPEVDLDRSMTPIYPGDALVIARGVLHHVKALVEERSALVVTSKLRWKD